jgi:UPF0755 protein
MYSKKISIGSALIIVLALVFAGVISYIHFLQNPLSQRAEPFVYTLAPGTSAKTMIKELRNQGMFNRLQAQLFSLILTFQGSGHALKAGEYGLAYNMTPEALYTKLMKGEVILHAIRLPEACTFEEALQLLWQHQSVSKQLQGKSIGEILGSLCQSCPNPEGILFPDTYYFKAKTTDLALLQLAYKTMNTHLENEWRKRAPDIVLKTPYEVLILASIIEKEAALVEERALISGVFQLRLVKNMRLQADPTVIYGLGKSFNGDLTVADLKTDTVYNTYTRLGLPPTPIALPSLQSIHAACHPVITDKLYFVAKGDGTHYFSATLAEHNQAVAKYQKLSETKG